MIEKLLEGMATLEEFTVYDINATLPAWRGSPNSARFLTAEDPRIDFCNHP
jgi:hypothetical protein